jgi:hypothetical protein
MTAMVVAATVRPSDERRKALSDEITFPHVSNFFPIETYGETAEIFYAEFQRTVIAMQSTQSSDSQVETFWDENYNKMLDFCYVTGKRYCRFCGALRTHNCYDASESKQLKRQHTIQVHRVLSILEEAANLMDIQEELSHRQQREELDRQVQIRWEHRQQQIQHQKQSNNTNQTTVDVQQSAFQTPKKTSICQLQVHYKKMYQKYRQSNKISVSSIDTYQGRCVLSESTYGCTVISALIAARHLNDTTLGTSISNDLIKKVIDEQCGPILRTIRSELGLCEHDFLIPSDAHDHLVDAKILHQKYFAGASGGNIMDPQHYGEFLKLLSDSETKTSNGKAGATLFFNEHVISIVKFTDATTNQIYFDLIDSMPVTLQNGKKMATRTRCCDAESLEVLLLWYASRKFSKSDCSYIDQYAWDDNMADLDPRVFQGFVWST